MGVNLTAFGAMLSPSELADLLRILDDHANSFEKMTEAFTAKFSKSEYFRVASGVFLLLQNRVLSLGSRLNSYYLLFDLYKSEPLPSNPFCPSFWLPPETNLSAAERSFLLIILNGKALALATRSANECLDLPNTSLNVDLKNLTKAYQIRQASVLSAFTRTGITPPIIDDAEDISLYRSEWNSADSQENARQKVLHKLLASETFEPRYLRPPPPLLKPTASELLWLNPEEERWPLWIYSTSTTDNDLLIKAMNETLSPEQVDELRENIKQSPQIVETVPPNKFPSLVENNFLVAVDVLLHLMASSGPTAEYFSALANTPITLHSMEAVNKLTTLVDLPADFLRTYISNGINTCQSIKDKHLQQRMIKLVCVFLQYLVKNKANIKALNSMIQSFCVEHSNNKEAAALFKLLKEQQS